MSNLGGNPRSRASTEPASRLGPSGFDHGREEWRPALIAYWNSEFLTQRAADLKAGAPFDYMDERAIESIKAALAELREAA